MYYINTQKQTLCTANTYEHNLLDETSVLDWCHKAAKFGVFVGEGHRPTLCWLPKFHKSAYEFNFIGNSSSCTTTEFSIILLLALLH